MSHQPSEIIKILFFKLGNASDTANESSQGIALAHFLSTDCKMMHHVEGRFRMAKFVSIQLEPFPNSACHSLQVKSIDASLVVVERLAYVSACH